MRSAILGNHRLHRWLLPLGLLAIWALMANLRVWPAYKLPTPEAVLQTLMGLLSSHEFLGHALISLQRLLLGFFAGAGVGSLLAVGVGASALTARLVDPTVQAIRTVPLIAWIPLFVLWLGVGEAPKVVLIALGSFFPVYLSLSTAIARTDKKLLEVAQANRVGGLRKIVEIFIPAALPAYFIGLRTGMGLSWMFLAAAEIMGASHGIGYLLLEGQMAGQPETIIACATIFALGGKLSDMVLSALANRCLSWQDTATA